MIPLGCSSACGTPGHQAEESWGRLETWILPGGFLETSPASERLQLTPPPKKNFKELQGLLILCQDHRPPSSQVLLTFFFLPFTRPGAFR